MEEMTASGQVEAVLVSPDGVRTSVETGKNTLSYRCAGAMAHLFAGQTAYLPSKIGFVTGPSDVTFNFTEGTRGQDTVGTTGLTVVDVAIDPNPSFAAVDTGTSPNVVAASNYLDGNRVAFKATYVSNESTYVHGFILKGKDDKVLAVRKLATKAQKPASFAMAVSWAVTFV